MIPQNTFSYLMAAAAILDIIHVSHQNRKQCNLWTVMMCLCENNQIESWQIQMGENEHYVVSGYIWFTTLHA